MAKPSIQRDTATRDASTIDSVIVDAVGHHLSNDFPEVSVAGSPARWAQNPARQFAENLQQQIAKRAYELAERRGFAPGNDVEDWLRAEQEVLAAP